MPTEPHVAFRRLVDRRDGRLPPTLAARVDGHLGAGCAVCRDEADSIERLIAAIEAGPPEAPPARLLSAAIRLFRESFADFARDVDCVFGVLLLDRTDEFAAALRSAPGETRHLLWRVGDYEVDASLVARTGGIDVLAQIVPGGDDPDAVVVGTVAARDAGGVRARARVAADGRFTFRGLPAGVYTLEGRVDSFQFVLPPIRVE